MVTATTTQTLDEISANLKLADSKKYELSKTFQYLHSHSSSILGLTLQWQNLHSHFDTIQISLKSQFKSLKSKQEFINSQILSLKSTEAELESLKSRQQLVDLQTKDLKSKETELEFQFESLKSRHQLVDSQTKDLKYRETELESKEESLNLQQRCIDSQLEDLKSRETDLKSQLQLFKSKEEIFNSQQQFSEAELEKRVKTLEIDELRIRYLEKCLTDTISKVKVEPVHDDDDGSELRFSVSMDGRGLQYFLNERVCEHEKIGDEVLTAMKMSLDPAKLVLDAMEGFYPLSCKATKNTGVMVFELEVVRKSCVLLLEQLVRVCPKIRLNVREAAKKLLCEWKGKMTGEEELEVLGFLLLLGVYDLVSEFDKDEIARLFMVVKEHKLASQLQRILDINDADADADDVRGIIPPAVNIEQSLPENSELNKRVASPSESPWPELKSFCTNMDSNNLRLFLSEHVREHEAMQNKVYEALHCASDPVKLVLDAVYGFNSSNFDRVKRLKSGASKRSCILLLGQLIRFSPQIEPVIKEAALKIAAEWKGEFLKQDRKPVKVLGFLQLVVTFELTSSFVVDELLSLLKTVYQQISAPDLFRVLALISDFVNLFVKNKCLSEALRYVYAFDLVDKFPPAQILKAHVDYWMYRSKKLCKELHLSHSQATKRELDALRVVIKCIADFKLESEFYADIIDNRVKQLEKENEDGKSCAEPTPTSNAQPDMQSGVKRPRKEDAHIILTSTSIPVTSSTPHSIKPDTLITKQVNVEIETKHSQSSPVTSSSIVESVKAKTISSNYPVQLGNPSIVHSTQPNERIGIQPSQIALSTKNAQTFALSTCTSSNIYSVKPGASLAIHSTQPNQENGFKRPRTMISIGDAKHAFLNSNNQSAQQNWQAANEFTNHGAPFSRPPGGYHNSGGSNPYLHNMNPSIRPYSMPVPNLGLSAPQYRLGHGANNANNVQMNMAGTNSGNPSQNHSMQQQYYPPFKTH